MESTTATTEQGREAGSLSEPTVCAAFQATAAEHGDRTAIRTKGDEFSITWAEYADRVRRLAAGLAGIGLSSGDMIALMLTNRPEFHLADAAAMHLGAIPFSIYNTYSPEEIDYLVSDAENRIVVTEEAFLDKVLDAQKRNNAMEHVICVDGGGDGTLSIEEVVERGDGGFDFDAA